MHSAFGVDHGEEISKVTLPFQRRRDQAKAQEFTAQRKAASAARRTKVADAGKKAVNAKVSVADVGRAASKPVVGLGNLASKNPGAAGLVALGGGGYALHRVNQRKDLPRKRS